MSDKGAALTPQEGQATATPNTMSIDREALRKVFRRFDRDKSRSVDVREMAAMVKELKLDITAVQLKEMVKEADTAGNGSIDFDEFHKLLTQQLAKGGGLADIVTSAVTTFGWFNPFSWSSPPTPEPVLLSAEAIPSKEPTSRAGKGYQSSPPRNTAASPSMASRVAARRLEKRRVVSSHQVQNSLLNPRILLPAPPALSLSLICANLSPLLRYIMGARTTWDSTNTGNAQGRSERCSSRLVMARIAVKVSRNRYCGYGQKEVQGTVEA